MTIPKGSKFTMCLSSIKAVNNEISMTCEHPMTLQFRAMMCASMDGQSIAKFWGHLKTLGCYSEHRVLHDLTEAELRKTIPFAIHGDGAEFHRHNEYFVMSWTSAFQCGSGGNCLVSRYPISLVAEAHMVDDSELWR